MSLAKKMWTTLSKVDVRKYIEQKGGLNYLSWAWAWGALMEHYPETTYVFSDRTFSDGTMEVYCDLTIREGEETFTRHMWLAVMGNRNEAVKNPSSTQINKAKMRCLTKAIGMCGLGHHIYAGEDLILDEIAPIAKPQLKVGQAKEYMDGFVQAVMDSDQSTARELEQELIQTYGQEVCIKVFKKLDGTIQTQLRELIYDQEAA